MNKLLLLLFFAFTIPNYLLAQCNCKDHMTEQVFRVTLLNPGLDVEWAILPNATVSVGAGVGFTGGEMPYMNDAQSLGWKLLVSPYADLQFRRYYTLNKRLHNRKPIRYNSGNFFGARTYFRGPSLASTFNRSENTELILGPIWGLQRTKGAFSFIFSTGPIGFTDFTGKYGFYPFYFDVNIAVLLSK